MGLISVNIKGNVSSSVDEVIESMKAKILKRYEEVGEEAVEVAKKTGDYHDVTGRLRASNKYKATPDELLIYNDAPYAKEVEARGKIVLSSAILWAEAELNNPDR